MSEITATSPKVFPMHFLPEDLQIEIFSFLSLKHVGKLLSINKSTHIQLDNSESFWYQLTTNYSKFVDPSPTTSDQIKHLSSCDKEPSNNIKYSPLLKTLIKKRNLKRDDLSQVKEHIYYKKKDKIKMIAQCRMEIEDLLFKLGKLTSETHEKSTSDLFSIQLSKIEQVEMSIQKESEVLDEKLVVISTLLKKLEFD